MTWGQARPIPLSHAEVQLLKLMGMSADYVEREALMATIAGDYDKAPVTKARLELLISRLRAKLMPHTGTENVIKSVRGRGYQLCLHLQLKPV